MKKITDTYFALDGDKYLITKNTLIECQDKVAKEQIELTFTENQKNKKEIAKISFCKINDYAKCRVVSAFGDVYKEIEDSYIIEIANDEINVYCDTENAVRYAACAIVNHYDCGIKSGLLYNAPLCKYRGIKVYVPAEEDIPFFKKFIDMCMNFGYNKLVMEIGGAMEYKKHPEINEGWVEFCNDMNEYFKDGDVINKIVPWSYSSVHLENGGGKFLTREKMNEICQYCETHGIEIIPEVPSLSHSDYLLTRHPEFAEDQNDPYPRNYCPCCDGVYDLVFDVLDEVIEQFNPKMIHIAHDEWTGNLDVGCEKCAGKDPVKLYADDVTKIHDYLAKRGIRTMMWSDMLIDRGSSVIKRRYIKNGKKLNVKGKEYDVYDVYWHQDAELLEEGVYKEYITVNDAIKMIPKDILIMDWQHSSHGGEHNVVYFKENGFECVYGNYTHINGRNWFGRVRYGLSGASLSNWSYMNEQYMQRNCQLFGMVFLSMMFWNRDYIEYQNRKNSTMVAKELFNYKHREIIDKPHVEIVHAAKTNKTSLPCSDGQKYNTDDEKMGCYKIIYQDGTQETVDILYGTNIGNIDNDFDELVPGGAWRGDLAVPVTKLFSTSYTCDYVFDKEDDGEKVYYKFLVPTTKKVIMVIPEIYKQYEKDIVVKEIKIK